MNEPVKTRKCRECKKEFELTRKDRRFCCEKCRNKNWISMNPRIKKTDNEV